MDLVCISNLLLLFCYPKGLHSNALLYRVKSNSVHRMGEGSLLYYFNLEITDFCFQ